MKKCPFCAEQIQDDAVTCRYCGSVLDEASGAGTPPAAFARPPETAFGAPASPDNPREAEVRRLIDAGHKIAAIELVREQTGLGLKEAKDRVDAMARHLNAGRLQSQVPAANSPKGGFAAVVAVGLRLAVLAWFFGWFGRS